MKLQQGDYVTDLTEEQFDELVKLCNSRHLTWANNSKKAINDIICSLVYNEGETIHHTFIEDAVTKLSFTEFKQRAINTFER